MARKPSAIAQAKQERLAHANELIRIIGSHGRRFFWYRGSPAGTGGPTDAQPGRFARLVLKQGRVYLIDDYTQKAVYTHTAPFGNRWHGFSHGGTLRSLVEHMRDYVMHGTQLPRWMIVICRTDDLQNNIWGYEPEAAAKVRELAYALPIIEPATD